jgi:hypothetical protein
MVHDINLMAMRSDANSCKTSDAGKILLFDPTPSKIVSHPLKDAYLVSGIELA